MRDVMPQLQLAVNSVAGSLDSLVWSIVLMLVFFTLISLWLIGAVADYATREDRNAMEEDVMMEHFGSLERAVFTLIKASFGEGWFRAYDALAPVGWVTCAVYLVSLAFIYIALLNIVLALFIEKATKLDNDMETAVESTRKEQLNQIRKLQEVLTKLDVDGDGTFSREEFDTQMDSNGSLRKLLDSMGLLPMEADLFISVLLDQSGNGKVTVDDFIEGIIRLSECPSSKPVFLEVLTLHQEVVKLQGMLLKRQESSDPLEGNTIGDKATYEI
jgi:BMFP domain-containing protein YqiC